MNSLRNILRWLFDFSAGQREGKRMERLFRVALAETTTEAEFYSLCYRMVQEDDYLRTQVRWGNVMSQLDQFRGLREKDWRTPVYRLIAYLPRYYGYESAWDEDSKQPKS